MITKSAASRGPAALLRRLPPGMVTFVSCEPILLWRGDRSPAISIRLEFILASSRFFKVRSWLLMDTLEL